MHFILRHREESKLNFKKIINNLLQMLFNFDKIRVKNVWSITTVFWLIQSRTVFWANVQSLEKNHELA